MTEWKNDPEFARLARAIQDEVVDKLEGQAFDRVPKGQVLEIRGGHHWIFVSHRDEVLAAVRKFLAEP